MEEVFKLYDYRCEYCAHSLNYTRKVNEDHAPIIMIFDLM